jgi:cell division protein FtsW (lipid II flippase)
MNLAPPLSRPAGKRPVETRERTPKRSPTQSTAKSRGGTLQRERHQPDYTILVAVVSLASIGILMVYSSSAMRGYLSSANDTFAIVGPQIQWALLGLVAMVAMMRVDYRYLRLV